MNNITNGAEAVNSPNSVTMANFLSWWFARCTDGCLEIGYKAPSEPLKNFQQFRLGQWQEAADFAADLNQHEGWDLYIRASTVKPRPLGASKDEDVIQTPGIWCDLDTVGQVEHANSIKSVIKPTAYVVTGTAPGPRVQLWFRAADPIADRALAQSLARRVIELYGGDPVHNPSRLMRMPGSISWPKAHKPGRIAELTQLHFRPNAEMPDGYPLDAFKMMLPFLPEQSAVTTLPIQTDLTAADRKALADVIRKLPNDGRYDDRDSWVTLARAIQASFAPDYDLGLALFVDHASRWHRPVQKPDEAEALYKSVKPPHRVGAWWIIRQADEAGVGISEYRMAEAQVVFEAEPAENRPVFTSDTNHILAEWQDRLLRSGKKSFFANLANAVTALTLAPEWQCAFLYNAFADRPMILAPLPGDTAPFTPRELTDADCSRIAIWLQFHDINVGTSTATEATLTACHKNTINPVMDYLTGIRWDRQPRLDTILVDHLGCQDTRLVRAFGSKTLISSVARIIKPGAQVRAVLTLEGPQELGKSLFCVTLLPDPIWFTDTAPDIGTKDAMQQLRGIWIQEHAEMATLGKADANKAKAFISKNSDDYRPPYGRLPRKFPRQCIFIATVNPGGTGYLRDETGATRFWPVLCGETWEAGRVFDADGLAAVRDQLWAEAVARYQAGELWWLDDAELREEQKQEADERYADEAWSRVVMDYVDGKAAVTTDDIKTNVLHISTERWTNAHMQAIGRILRHADWRRKQVRVNGKRTWAYFPQGDTESLEAGKQFLEAEQARCQREASALPSAMAF